jgi:tetratricopeptide (TPR) repeat protein
VRHTGIVLAMAALLCSPIAAAGSSSRHRARADEAETLGHLADAAREYEAAWQEERAPELLYRLGIVRRKLREFAKAKEAFRGYLRVAPDGALKDEVERQLVKLAVLMEAQQEEAAPQRRSQRPSAPAKPAAKLPAGSEAAAKAAALPEPATLEPPTPERAAPQAVVLEPAPRPPDPPARAPETAAPRALLEVPRAAIQAPRTALETPRAQDLPARSTRAAPWLAAGAAVAASAGATFWWDGARVSRELDARFAAGELRAADAPRYGRAQNEAIAGRVLVAAALALAGTALVLW